MAGDGEKDAGSGEEQRDLLDIADGENDPDIQALLDNGYDLLDGFMAWLEQRLGLDARAAQQDCFNAEALIDYLANHSRKSAFDMNEFDLRWFVFSHYIRKAMADAETEARLLGSLQRFFEFLRAEQHFEAPPWLREVLTDQDFYLTRRQEYTDLDAEDERLWEEGFRVWCAELEDDLDARCLWLPREIGNGIVWGDRMGWREATLYEEANRLWQEERARLLQEGRDYESIRAPLIEAYTRWSAEPQARLEGSTPYEVILEERGEHEED